MKSLPDLNSVPVQRVCPEYYFELNPWGMARRVPCILDGGQDFYGQEYFADYESLSSAFAQRLSPRCGDWLELAIAIYLADRFAPRRDPRFRKDPVHRRRRMHLQVPVVDLDFWRSKETQQLLQGVLWSLTEDVWEFSFVSRSRPLAPCVQEFLFDLPMDRPVRVALFSGGLDSFAGGAFQLMNWGNAHVFVSGVTHGRMLVGQRSQIARLRGAGNSDIRHVQIWYGVEQKKASDRTLELSQRSRGFVHVTLGAVAALLAHTDELHMYENGIGALNLPFDASQIGIETSKAANPVFHRAMERFIESVSGRQFRIINPFQFLTKGEALRAARLQEFADVLVGTFSCDRFPDWHEGKPQCGICASCVLRRLSLEASGLAKFDPGTVYARDLKSSGFIPGDSGASILSHYEEQVLKIEKSLAEANPWSALAMDFPEIYEAENALLSGECGDRAVRRSLLQLLRGHVAEWRAFSGRAALGRYLKAA